MNNKFNYLIFAFITQFCFIAFAAGELNEEFFSEEVECPVQDSYRYASIGVGPIIFIPNVGIGYRERNAEWGWDTGLSFSTIGYAHQLTAHLVGHYYLSPSKINSAYLGLGIMGSGILTNKGEGAGTLSPTFVFGKELGAGRHFIEMHVGVPTFWMGSKHRNTMYLPLMYIKYGIAF